MTDFDRWRTAATRPRATGHLCLDGEAQAQLLETLVELGDEREMAKGLLDGSDHVERLAERVKELDALVVESTRTFVFERIPRGAWRELEDAHPASDAQKAKNPKQTIDPESYEPALAAACCVDPGLSVEDAEWLRDFVTEDDWVGQVLGPVMRANKGGAKAPKGVSAIADRLITELRSTTRAPEVSPSPSSEDV